MLSKHWDLKWLKVLFFIGIWLFICRLYRSVVGLVIIQFKILWMIVSIENHRLIVTNKRHKSVIKFYIKYCTNLNVNSSAEICWNNPILCPFLYGTLLSTVYWICPIQNQYSEVIVIKRVNQTGITKKMYFV